MAVRFESRPSAAELYDDMFRTRARTFPEALEIAYWETHWVTQETLQPGALAGLVLDVGCGTGEIDVLLARAGHHVTACDVSPVALGIARGHLAHESPEVRQRVTLVPGTEGPLPFADQSFQTVLLSHVLEHIAHPTPLLKELARVLAPGGALLVFVPLDHAFDDPTHEHYFLADTLCALLAHYFEDVAVTVSPDGQQLKAICVNREATRHPRVLCQMRIKNEERWLKEVLDSIALTADGIVIFDDGSTDRTPEICRAHPAVLEYHRQENPVLDEVRDKNILLKLALKHQPEWILCIDGDEILEDSAPERIFEAIRRCPPHVAVLDVEFLYMWDDVEHYRTDGIYGRIYHHRLFTVRGQDAAALSFKPSGFGGNFHCESVPPNICGEAQEIDVKVKHLGYMRSEDRARKYEWYKQHDPEHGQQGYYEHLLDQPGMTIAQWQERPWRLESTKVPKYQSTNLNSASGAGVKQELKPDYYYANARRNLVELIPAAARRVLDVGCGRGMTGGLLRAERGIEVVGLEIHPGVAEEARKHLSRVVVGDLETMELPFEDGYFDALLMGDVLEHLTNPWAGLKKLVRCLNPDGMIVASIPNIRNLGVIGKLIEGSWAYEEWGILDKTHLRFFALKDMRALFESAGIDARVVEVVRDPLFEKAMATPPTAPRDIDMGSMLLRQVNPQDLDELTAQQFIFTGVLKREENPKSEIRNPSQSQSQKSASPVVSVIIPVFNNVEYTRQCITSLFAVKEQTAFEIVVVDDGSSDGTAEYLRQLTGAVTAVTNAVNSGFAKSCNGGAKAARGEYLVFLNNDTVVQPGWLDAMMECVRQDAGIGLVGNLQVYPDNGRVQHAGIVCGADKVLYSIYNNELPAEHPAVNKARELQFVAGSCMLFESDFFFRLGGFDEGYLNSCEDVDLCMQVRAAGKKVYYCPQSRILHFESRTVSGHPKDSGNYQRFLARWGDKLVRDDIDIKRADGMLTEAVSPAARKKVVLIAPPRYLKEAHLSSYCGFSKNVGLASLAASLRAAGAEVAIIDAFALGGDNFTPVDLPNGQAYRCGLSYEAIAARVPHDADVVGISVPFSNVARIAFELAAYLKQQFPQPKIVLGGVHPSAFPVESLREGVDYVLRGEAEESLAALVRGDDLASIAGLVWRDASGIIRQHAESARIADLDTLPLPAWDLLPMDLYFRASQRGNTAQRTLSIVTSRGCPFACRFCSVHPVSGRNWRALSAQHVLAEVKAARERFGIEHLEIEDDNFTLDKARAIAILKGLSAVAPGITWSAHNGVRIDTLDAELLRAIKESGCTQLNIAVEHGSPAVLKAMNKKLSLDKVREVVRHCGELGIRTVGFCLVGYPGETAAAFAESFRFFQELKRLGLTTISPFVINAYPATDLYREAAVKGWLNPATDEQLFFLEDEFVSVTTPDFDAATVRLRKQAMEILNEHPQVDAAQLLAQLPAPLQPATVAMIPGDPLMETARAPKVAILTTYNQQCGLATYAEFLVAALQAQGIEPLILAERSERLRGAEPAHVIRCWMREPNGGEALPALLKQHGIEVLHVNHGGIFPLEGWLEAVLTVARQMGVRIVLTFHTTETLAGEFARLSSLADRVLVHHPQNTVELAALGAPVDRFEVVPHGMPAVVPTDIFEEKLALDWDPARKVVSTFGFVEPHKGVHELISAMRPSHQMYKAQLQVLGGGHPNNPHSQRYIEACRQRAQELGMGADVIFANSYLPEEEVVRRLRASDAIVMNYQSARYESSGATMIALATGRPVITSAAPSFDFPEALTFKTTATFHLAEALVRVLANPFIGTLLLKNVQAYEKTARWDVVAARVAEIYRAVASEEPRSPIDIVHWYRSHPDEIYAEPLQRERVRWLRSKAEGRILEVGPANGYVSQFVGAAAAVDINRGRLEVCKLLRPSVSFQHGDVIEGLPFKDKEFDQVLAPEILEHVDFDQAVSALRECARVGKRVLITIPNGDKPDYDPSLVHNIEHRWLVNRQSVDRLLRECELTDYELDTSEELDFYLLDIRTESRASRALIHKRAALLPSINVDPGEPVHVVVDASALEEASARNRGIGRYMLNHFRELVALRPEWRFTLCGLNAEPSEAEIRELTAAANCSYREWNKLATNEPEVLYLPHPLGDVGMEVLRASARSRLFIACTFHDLVPLLMPQAYLNPNESFKQRYVDGLRGLKERCDLFLCNSQCTAQDLQVHLQIEYERLRIIHAGVTQNFVAAPEAGAVTRTLQRYGLQAQQFLLFVGVPDPRKNALGMGKALKTAREALKRDLKLVIAGDVPDFIREAVARMADEYGLPQNAVVCTGFVPDAELSCLYRGALALLFPSMYEGFGFPILEAMSAGLPVIAGDNSSQGEIAGEAALLVNAQNVDEITRAIQKLATDDVLWQDLSKQGLAQYQRFTWRKTAEKTAIYLAEAYTRWKRKHTSPPEPVRRELAGV